MTFFQAAILNFFFLKKIFFLLHLIKKTKGFHMRYHFFLQYGWFLQNLGKDFIPTNMHTTVVVANLKASLFKTVLSLDRGQLQNNVLNFYLPKSCFRIQISIQNLKQYLESKFKFQNCKSLHKNVKYLPKMRIQILKIELEFKI